MVRFSKTGSDAGTGNVREDIESHVEMWRNYNSLMYTEQDLEGLIELLKGYSKEEILRQWKVEEGNPFQEWEKATRHLVL